MACCSAGDEDGSEETNLVPSQRTIKEETHLAREIVEQADYGQDGDSD